MSAVFVFGVEGELRVKFEPPRVFRGESQSVGSTKKTPWIRYGWPAAGTSWTAADGRHVEEFKSSLGEDAGKRVWFRRLADDAVPLLAEIDREIEKARAEVTRLNQERQKLLASWLPNSSRVRISECFDPRTGAGP